MDDLESGLEALNIIPNHIAKRNKDRVSKYEPNLVFIKGNHENRLNRMLDSNPHLIGLIDLDKMIESTGFKPHEYLHPAWIDGICFNHYMPNPESGKAIGGGIENKINKHPHSFVHGHQQKFQFGRRQTLSGSPLFGVCAGSFYLEDEDYRGSCNTEVRGFVHMKNFKNRFGFSDHDIEFVSVERLDAMYGVGFEYT